MPFSALLDAWAVLSPVTCAGCGADDRALCAACLAGIRAHPLTTILPGGLEVTSALRYEHAVRRIVLALKEGGRTDIVMALARPLAEAVTAAVRGEVEIVTVPSTRAAYRRRGADPVSLLLRAAGIPHSRRLLRWTRRTISQKSLGRDQRGANLVGSLRVKHPVAGCRFVVVDDVLTTGATLLEAARALETGGATVVAAATLAFTPLRHPVDSATSLGMRAGARGDSDIV